VQLDERAVPVHFEHVIANRHRFPCTTGTTLLPPGSGRQLEIHYTAPSMMAADRLRFRHRLEGHDTDWSEATDLRVTFFTNLRPQAYRFQLQVANARGLWEEPHTLAFAIQPYFWETWMFAGLVAAGVLAFAIILHRLRLRRHRELTALQHAEALAAERTRIAADMHDDLGAALTQIAVLGDLATDRATDPDSVTGLVGRMTTTAREVTARISDLVWATNPQDDTLENLAAYLREQVARQLDGTNLRVRLDFSASLPAHHLSATFRRNVLLATKEALNNVLKHAAARTGVVRFAAEGSRLVVAIEDNGDGFDPASQAAAGNGLTNLRRRIAELGGNIQLDSAPGRGTRVTFEIPLPDPG